MQILPEWAPGIHPLIIHFPIVLITLAIALDLLSIIKRIDHIKQWVSILYVLGTVGVIASFFSGRYAADSLTIPEGYYEVYPAISNHANVAFYTVLFFIVYAIIRTLMFRFSKDKNRSLSVLMFFFGLIGFFLVMQTADKGAELVYRYGMGTQILSKLNMTEKAIHPKNGLIQKKNGSWEWIMNNNAAVVLDSQFTLIKGNNNNLNLEDEGEQLAITVSDNETYFYIYDQGFSDIALMAEINLDAFNGRFSLVHHVTGNTQFDFLDVDGKEIRLGRSTDGKTMLFDQALISTKGWFSLKAIGTKGHFRGYVNDELVLHGHGKDLPSGQTGFIFSGKGKILLKNIKTESIDSATNIKDDSIEASEIQSQEQNEDHGNHDH
ncbi:MAG: hypothetical protein D8M58_17430 [Calditrichaeota bacterium]|nr:MAG: hypothetical protein DWQ03_01345 [Calditrichota bacterium]MBL1207189.1 hypothetical protein [Calditrichota bacterium]NOG47022.1 hypothetical protein [Calditrichota bacterium]